VESIIVKIGDIKKFNTKLKKYFEIKGDQLAVKSNLIQSTNSSGLQDIMNVAARLETLKQTTSTGKTTKTTSASRFEFHYLGINGIFHLDSMYAIPKALEEQFDIFTIIFDYIGKDSSLDFYISKPLIKKIKKAYA